jgi:hypothetical protein
MHEEARRRPQLDRLRVLRAVARTPGAPPNGSAANKTEHIAVRASHSDAARFAIRIDRVSGIPSDSEVLDTRGWVWAAAVNHFWLHDSQFLPCSYFPAISVSTHSYCFHAGGRTRLRARCGGHCGCPGSGDYECGYRGDPGGNGNSLSLGHGFGGTIRGGHAASGERIRRGRRRKGCRRRFLR